MPHFSLIHASFTAVSKFHCIRWRERSCWEKKWALGKVDPYRDGKAVGSAAIHELKLKLVSISSIIFGIFLLLCFFVHARMPRLPFVENSLLSKFPDPFQTDCFVQPKKTQTFALKCSNLFVIAEGCNVVKTKSSEFGIGWGVNRHS